MDSRQLRYFREIVDNGSMSGAARNLGIAQPSLSQLVRNLEETLGVELLVRTARGVLPTEAGQRLYHHARHIENYMESAREDVVNTGSEPSGKVLFGMPPTLSMALSIPMAETIRIEMPKVKFGAIEAMSGHLRDWIIRGEIDLALLYDITNIGDCSHSLLLTEDLWFYSSEDDWPFKTPPLEPVDLKAVLETELVLPSQRHGLRTFIERMAQSQQLEPKIAIEMDSLTQIKALVARSSGYTILSPVAVHDLVSDGTLIGSPIVNPSLRRNAYLVRSANSGVTLACRKTEDTCREVVANLVERGLWQADLPDKA